MKGVRLHAPYTPEWVMQWVLPEPNSGCWLWTASLNKGGYGSLRIGYWTRSAHRVSYEVHKGKIPMGMDLDHLCRVRCCVNPDHLEPVTHRENLRRGKGNRNLAQAAIAKTHCPKGHPYAGANLYVSPKGSRDCVACQRQRVRDWRGRKLICTGVAA